MPIKTKRTKPRRKVWLTLFNILIITLILSVVLTAGVIFTIVRGAVDKMPDMDLTNIELDESPTIYDANGGILSQDLTEQFRRSVPYEEISPEMIDAIVAIETPDPGYDWLFAHRLAGLVTAYGGEFSHMGVRCSEFGMPAVLGCGPTAFARIASASAVRIDADAGAVWADGERILP